MSALNCQTATYSLIAEKKGAPIEILWNPLVPKLNIGISKAPKYKKVGKQGKSELLRLV